jgi:uncharacterized membrane protein YphA (DoxX/SURF4 family)
MPVETPAQAPVEEETGSKKNPVLSAALAVVAGCVLAILVLVGVISGLTAVVIFVVIVVVLLVFHGGGSDITSGLSDQEGYERELEEEEQRKAQEAEEAGEMPDE